MKTRKSVWQMVHRCIVALLFVCACWSCDEIEPLVPTPDPENEVGEVEFVINVNNDSIVGGDVSDEPTTVTQGDTLSVVVSQKSSYTDPDGTVFTCEPKATIELFATVDTIYAKDIETLLKINENADVTTAQSGTNPVLYTINQKFMIGDQEVVFDLGHEVYSYVNSLSNVIEMPYIKVNEAKFGNGDVSQGDKGTRNSSPFVTLRALSLTRASVTDSLMFEVSAKFNLELESVNTKNENKETLEFNVNYVGVVENVTELYGSVVYTINDKNGEVKSPFVVNGSDTLSLEIKEKSTYALADTAVYSFEPKATISLKVKNDTTFVEKYDLLSALIETEEPKASSEGKNPKSNLYEQVFATSSQEFLFETMYEVYTAQSGDEMPYLMIGEPKCIGIEVTEQKKDATTRGFVYDTVYYDVKAKFEVELNGVNVSDELANTLEFEVNYVGGLINVENLKGRVAYTINDKNGEVKSPFVINGSDSLLLEIKQKSTYSTANTSVYSFEPKATINLKVKNDTAFVEKYELLSTLIETEDPKVSASGENPKSNLHEQVFATSSQEFLFETMYEVYTAQSGDEMPYLMIGEPKCIGIEVTEQKKDATTRGFVYDTVYYDVKAKFEVELNGVNVSDELLNTLEFEVNYVGGVINATEVVELVNITYRKNQVFYAGHDNLLPASQCEVYRDRHYSDGHVETDEFYDAPWMWVEYNVTLGCGSDVVDHFRDTMVTYLPDFTVSYENFNRYSIKTDNIYVYQRGATCIPSFENVELVLDLERNEVPDRYDETYGAELKDYNFNPDSPIEGWYVKDHVKSRYKLLKYVKDGNSFPFRGYLITMSYYDRFLCVDDTIIGFEEFRPKIESFETFDDYGGSDVHGPGKIYQYVTKGEYLDHTFYLEVTDTIYTPKK